MDIRISTESDRNEILNIHTQAFGKEEGPIIAKLVDDLFADKTAEPRLSMIASDEKRLIGHILFTRAVVTQAQRPISAQILAPLAVLPEVQKRGIGQKLIHEGLRHLKSSGIELVFVLGHPSYYPRCGFIPAGEQGFDAPHPIPAEHADAWMVVELNGEVLGKNRGKIQCSKMLNEPQYWQE